MRPLGSFFMVIVALLLRSTALEPRDARHHPRRARVRDGRLGAYATATRGARRSGSSSDSWPTSTPRTGSVATPCRSPARLRRRASVGIASCATASHRSSRSSPAACSRIPAVGEHLPNRRRLRRRPVPPRPLTGWRRCSPPRSAHSFSQCCAGSRAAALRHASGPPRRIGDERFGVLGRGARGLRPRAPRVAPAAGRPARRTLAPRRAEPIRLDVLRAPRGAIRDRFGRLLADNQPSFDIVFRPMPAEPEPLARGDPHRLAAARGGARAGTTRST